MLATTLLHRTLTIKSIKKADVAQLVEQPIRNRQVTGSSPVVGSTRSLTPYFPSRFISSQKNHLHQIRYLFIHVIFIFASCV